MQILPVRDGGRILVDEVGEIEPGCAVLKAPFRAGTIWKSASNWPDMELRVGRLILVSISGDQNLVGMTFRVTANFLTKWGISKGPLSYQ